MYARQISSTKRIWRDGSRSSNTNPSAKTHVLGRDAQATVGMRELTRSEVREPHP
jgi:hypothetical protein